MDAKRNELVELIERLRDPAPVSHSYELRCAAAAALEVATRELKELDPDPVVCGCREAGCPHQPIARLPRQMLVDHFRQRIASLNADLERGAREAQQLREALNNIAIDRETIRTDGVNTWAAHDLRQWAEKLQSMARAALKGD
jgi:hypothetical protein